MARTENFRKVSTTLFHHRNGQAGDWSGLLLDHRNLMNHQLYFVASQPIIVGAFKVQIMPDTKAGLPTTADTGHRVDFGGNKDSALLNFTGIISGLHLRVVEQFAVGVTISVVLTSFSRMRQRGTKEERFDYISTTIFEDKLSEKLTNFSLPAPNHLNMAYHQLMIISDGPVGTGEWEIRAVPDSDEALESTVYLGKNLSFPVDPDTGSPAVSYIQWFGGIFKGLHLKSVVAPEAGHRITAVLSSSIERFDEVVHEYIGSSPTTDAHLLDFNNPHQTSWDNLLNKPIYGVSDWPVIKNSIETGETYTVPEGFQMLVWKEFSFDGGDLTLDGDLVVLGGDEDGLVKEYVGASESVFIPGRHQLLVAEAFEIEGTLDVKGALVIL